ncbi:uncharacterized protein LOC117327778 [Pecten maximus]|uniref:uncharacterized protein LOC117327778 n=1 Tax=Pecten maximus TaxID=6579 RepID=UPI001457F395|nr:uncharacterized protein LOC117327778 [Pecten maximus]
MKQLIDVKLSFLKSLQPPNRKLEHEARACLSFEAMPIANDKEIKSIFQDITSDEMVSEASLGSEALLPKGPVLLPSAASSDVHSKPRVRRRSREAGFTPRSSDKSRNNVENYLAPTTRNIVYELSSMLDQSSDFHADNKMTDQTQTLYGHPTTGCFGTEVCRHPRSNLGHHMGNVIDEHSMTGMDSEQTEKLAQTISTSSQTSYDTRMDHITRESGQFSTESESERDLGFSSHSTSSSCQFETSPTEQEQVDGSWNNFPIDWSDAEADICQHGNNKIDDLIYHFDKFFRGQIENKFTEMGDFIHSLMTEQQTHVRYIVNTAVTTSQTLTSFEKDTTLGSPIRKLTRLSSSQEVPGSPTVMSPVAENVDLSKGPRTTHKSIQVEDKRERLLLRILSTSCAVGCVLLRPEFHA